MGQTNQERDTVFNDFTKFCVHQLFDLNQWKEKCVGIAKYIVIEYHIKEYDLTNTSKFTLKGCPQPIQNNIKNNMCAIALYVKNE